MENKARAKSRKDAAIELAKMMWSLSRRDWVLKKFQRRD